MFNDPLTLPRCQDLIDELAQTDYPFMCAHGRQSISVIAKVGNDYVAERKQTVGGSILRGVQLK